uniref:Uncharacterized protein n=1 Tax=Panagrolaimus davidi TaxID=227884 RepID=A0A914PPH3_9BILA
MSDKKDSVMLLATSFYDKLDPKYREKLVELGKSLKLEKSGKTAAVDSLMDFFTQFMMPKEFWKKLFNNQELNMLIGYGNVEELYLWDAKDSIDDWFILEDLLSFTPKIKRLRFSYVCCTSKTSEILCELLFENKIQLFYVDYIKNTFLEPNAFVIFMQKNISPNSDIILRFDQNNPNYIRNFEETVNDFIEENWKEKEDKPCFSAV